MSSSFDIDRPPTEAGTTSRRGAALRRLAGARPPWAALAIGLVAIVFRLWVAHVYRDQTYSLVVKGALVSDARCWDTLADDFAHGTWWDGLWPSWSAHRPFYWIFVGAVYALTGSSVHVAQALGFGFGVASVLLLFEVLRRSGSTVFAWAGALPLAVSLVDARFSIIPATEPLGGFLTSLSLFFAVLGAEHCARTSAGDSASQHSTRPWLALVCSGACLGLANLTRPLNFLAAATVPLALLLVLWSRRGDRAARRRAVTAAAVFALGVAISVGPWVLRQRLRYGIWTVSTNSAEMLFAATSPRFGTWGGSVSALAPAGAPIRERVAFYENETRRNLREHPDFYRRNVWKHVKRIVVNVAPERWALLVTCAAFLLGRAIFPGLGRGWRRARAVAVPVLAAAAVALAPREAYAALWLGAVLLALVRRHPMALPGVLCLTSAATLPLLAISSDPRFLLSIFGLGSALGVWGLWQALAWAAGRPEPVPWRAQAGGAPACDPPFAASWGRAGRVLGIAAAAVTALWLLGLGRALVAHAGPARPRPEVIPPPSQTRAIVDTLLADPGTEPYRLLREQLAVRRASPRKGYLMRFAAGETVRHYNPLFTTPRKYSFEVFETRPAVAELYDVFPGAIDDRANQDLVLVGLPVARPMEGTSLEVIAFSEASAAPSAATFVLPPPAVRVAHAAHLASLMKKTPPPP